MYRWFLSLRYLRSRKTNWIGVAGIFVAVWALILILSIMAGFLAESRTHLRGNLADVIVMPFLDRPLRTTGEMPDPNHERMIEVVLEDERIAAASVQLVWYGMLTIEARSQVVQNPVYGDLALVNLVGIDIPGEYTTSDLKDNLKSKPEALLGVIEEVEDIDDPFRTPAGYESDGAPLASIVLGARLAVNWGLHKGDEVELVTARIDPRSGALSKQPINRRFVVAGTFRSGENEMDLERIYLERSALSDMLARETPWSQVLIKLVDYERDKEAVVADLRTRLHEAGFLHAPKHPILSKYEVQTWEDYRGNLLGAIENEKSLMGVMLSLVMVVAGFTIFAILSMMVSEKRRDIGIITALGGTPQGVLVLFLLIGCLEAVLGATLGTIAGIWSAKRIDSIEQGLSKLFGVEIFNRQVYLFDHIPSVIEPMGVILIVLGAVISTLVFSAIPAWRASRLDPIDALRYE